MKSDDAPLLVHLAFAGGGAKGFAHIGFMKALRTIEARRDYFPLEIMGFAGTSAGAIAASLFAAGYEPEELISTDTGTSPALKGIGIEHVGDLLGPSGRSAVENLKLLRRILGSPMRRAIIIAVTATLLVTALYGVIAFAHPIIATMSILAALLLLKIVPGFILKGFWSTQHLEKNLNKLLAKKLGLPEDKPVLFRDITKRPLRILATNLSTSEGRVFSNDPFDKISSDVPIASAVAASIAIPGVFRAVSIGNDLYFDGGIVSNLPIWTFARDTSSTPHTVVFAVNFPGYVTKQSRQQLSINKPWKMIWHLINAATFGDPAMERSAGASVVTCDMISELSTLDFDLLNDSLASLDRDATAAATRSIANTLTYFATGRDICRAIHNMFLSRLDQSSSDGRIRVVIMEPVEGRGHALRVVHSYNIGDDNDAAQLVSPIKTNEGAALHNLKPILCLADAHCDADFPMIWPIASWTWIVPLVVNNRVVSLLRVDSSIPARIFGIDRLDANQKVAIEATLATYLQKLLDTRLTLRIEGAKLSEQ